MVTVSDPPSVTEVIDRLAAVIRDLDVDVIPGEDASRLAELFVRGERLCATGKALAARRAKDCAQWTRAGARSPEEWLARLSGSGLGQARDSFEVADRIATEPALADACKAGALSPAQAAEISAATKHDPEATSRLIELAKSRSLNGLRDVCREVVASARSAADEQARYRAIHATRYLRTWIDRDGAGRLDARWAPDVHARVLACLQPFQDQAFEAGRTAADTIREKTECYRADAMLAMAEAAAVGQDADGPDLRNAEHPAVSPGGRNPTDSRSVVGDQRVSDRGGATPSSSIRRGPPATVIVLVDHAALVRGYVQGDECCVINGVGPVPVATVSAMLSDAFLASVVTDGVDIRSVAHLGRQVTAVQRTALIARDRRCVVPGCDVSKGLEIDHIRPWADTKVTTLGQLALLCRQHHYQKSYEGWTLTGIPGSWQWHPPPGGVPPGPFDDDGLKLAPPPAMAVGPAADSDLLRGAMF